MVTMVTERPQSEKMCRQMCMQRMMLERTLQWTQGREWCHQSKTSDRIGWTTSTLFSVSFSSSPLRGHTPRSGSLSSSLSYWLWFCCESKALACEYLLLTHTYVRTHAHNGFGSQFWLNKQLFISNSYFNENTVALPWLPLWKWHSCLLHGFLM